MYASDARLVRANTVYRDAYAGDDLFSIALDTYNDYQTASWFVVNPAGGRIDQTLSNDGERTDLPPYNIDWNSYWDDKTSRDETGWFAEMRIPFSSLGFLDIDGRVVMGLEVYRFIGSANERLIFPDIPPPGGLFRQAVTHATRSARGRAPSTAGVRGSVRSGRTATQRTSERRRDGIRVHQ